MESDKPYLPVLYTIFASAFAAWLLKPDQRGRNCLTAWSSQAAFGQQMFFAEFSPQTEKCRP
jgi:hypothetical protein